MVETTLHIWHKAVYKPKLLYVPPELIACPITHISICMWCFSYLVLTFKFINYKISVAQVITGSVTICSVYILLLWKLIHHISKKHGYENDALEDGLYYVFTTHFCGQD